MLEHPRLTREENRACKLTDEQIMEMKTRRANGDSYAEIARDYGVSSPAVYYWCLDDEARKEKTRRANLERKDKPREKYDHREYRKRKLALHPELMVYERQFSQEYKKENRPAHIETIKKADKRYRKKHHEEIIERHKEYRESVLGKPVWNEYCRRRRNGEKDLTMEKLKEEIAKRYENP